MANTGDHAYYMVTAYCDVMGWDNTDTVTARPAALIGVKRAYRRFLAGQHPDIPGATHDWSFLRPMGALQIPVYITGTASGVYATGSTTITATADKFTTGTHPTGDVGVGILVDGVGLMRITSYSDPPGDGTTVIALGGVANFSTKTFWTGMQIDMPADFGGLITPFYYPYDTTYSVLPLKQISVEEMLRWFQTAPAATTPDKYALVPMSFTSTVGQRYSVMFWPLSEADRVVHFRYRSVPADPTDVNTCYLAGGVEHSQTIEAAVRADAEFESRKKQGTYELLYQTQMMASIERDGGLFETTGPSRITEG